MKAGVRALTIIALLSIAPSVGSFAQMTNELGTIAAFSVKKNFAQKFSVALRQELWTKDNVTNLDLFLVRLTFGYNPLSWLSLGVSYDNLSTFIDPLQNGNVSVNSYIKNGHRAIVDATGTLKVGGLLSLSLRERYIYMYCPAMQVPACTSEGDYVVWEQEPSNTHTLRSRLFATCRIPNSKWSVYLGPEMFNSLNAGKEFALQQIRAYAGANFKLSEISSFKFYYCCQCKLVASEIHHLIGVEYYITL